MNVPWKFFGKGNLGDFVAARTCLFRKWSLRPAHSSLVFSLVKTGLNTRSEESHPVLGNHRKHFQVHHGGGNCCVFSWLWLKVLVPEFDFHEFTLSKLEWDHWVIKSFWAGIQLHRGKWWNNKDFDKVFAFPQKNHPVLFYSSGKANRNFLHYF